MNNESVPFIMLAEKSSDAPLYRQIYVSVRDAILSGRLTSGTRLPSSRTLAAQLDVSRITVVNAFDQLLAEGYLEGRTGAGTFVASQIPDELLSIRDPEPPDSRIRKTRPTSTAISNFAQKIRDERSGIDVDWDRIVPFRNGVTAVREFPFAVWEKIAVSVIRQASRRFRGYGEPAGYLPLREAIATHLSGSRGVRCGAGQVIVTSGAQQALDLVARVLLNRGDRVWVEDPCYQEALAVFRLGGAEVTAVPVDGDGFDASAAEAICGHAKLVYVTPSHQYPTGATMSLGRRLELLDWARRTGSWIVEDDYNSEFRYTGRPLASLQNLDRHDRVIYVGTFSKTVFPALRLGCLIVPPELAETFVAAKNLCDTHTALIEQAILAEFIAEGHFARHLRRMRSLYEKRQAVLVDESERRLDGMMKIAKASSGMHLIGWLRDGLDDRVVASKGRDIGLNLTPLSSYSVAKQLPPGLVLGYTGFNEREIAEGVGKLKKVLESFG